MRLMETEFRVNDPHDHLAGYNSEVTVTELLVNSRLHLAQDQKLASCQRTANESQPAVRDNDRELSRRSTFQQVCLNRCVLPPQKIQCEIFDYISYVTNSELAVCSLPYSFTFSDRSFHSFSHSAISVVDRCNTCNESALPH